MTAQAALERTGQEQSRPHEWLWDSPVDFNPGDLFILGARAFRVTSPQEVYDAEPITAHRKCVLTEIEPAPVFDSNPEL